MLDIGMQYYMQCVIGPAKIRKIGMLQNALRSELNGVVYVSRTDTSGPKKLVTTR